MLPGSALPVRTHRLPRINRRVYAAFPAQEFAAYQHEGRLVISTGSATGAYRGLASDGAAAPTPSFALMDVDGGKVGAGRA